MNDPVAPDSSHEEPVSSGQDLPLEPPVQPDFPSSTSNPLADSQAEVHSPSIAPPVASTSVVSDQVAYQPLASLPVEYPLTSVPPVVSPPTTTTSVPGPSAMPTPVPGPSAAPASLGYSQSPQPPQGYQTTVYPPVGDPAIGYQPQASYPPVGDPVAVYPPPDTTPAPAPKKSKKPLIIALSAVAAVILIVVGVLAFQEFSRSSTYDRASAAFDQGNYIEARVAFEELGEYRDASAREQRCLEYITYEDAIDFFEAGDYETARSKFDEVKDAGVGDIATWMAKIDLAKGIEFFEAGDFSEAAFFFSSANTAGLPEAAEWIDKADYAYADAQLTEGDVEGAYYSFLALGDYSDAAARATACTQAIPASGIVHQDGAFYYDYCALDITYNYGSPAFFKLYSGSTLAASLFINAGETVRVYLTPGSYTIKEGSGDVWFGPELAFGKQGWYSTMTFDETGTDFFTIGDGDLMTLVCGTEGDGNVSERDEDLSSF